MSDELKRKQRLMRIQKSVLAKSEMDYASTLRAKYALRDQIDEINELVQGDSMAAQVFPKLTYQHLDGLMKQSSKIDALNEHLRNQAIKEQKKLDLFGEAVATARSEAEKSNESKALSESSDRAAVSNNPVSATGKVKKLD